jgi:phospholipase A-2-activating protein
MAPQVHAVAVLSDDYIVTGGDDGMATVWRRIGASKDFASVHMCPEHTAALRAAVAIQPCPAFPTGGFATASLDKAVRLYSLDPATGRVEFVRALAGHMMGVISLSWTSTGDLLSGGWEGHARVWDIATGACKQVLEGHENGTCVLGLPNGDIVCGSTGRKNEHNQHVDYKLRIWRHSVVGGRPGYSIAKVISDHEQAVMDLALLAGGGGFASVGNDGTCRVRTLDGAVVHTFVNDVSEEGKPFSVLRVGVLADGTVATANEDGAVRLYDAGSGVAKGEVRLPGEWAWGRGKERSRGSGRPQIAAASYVLEPRHGTGLPPSCDVERAGGALIWSHPCPPFHRRLFTLAAPPLSP